ncbi:uncharacterized protein SCHCODRAFT_02497231 [Schizophyllum commune H4-8]|uniref:uncharacterized protein n=1 Tax=Schizophyllum commune (strain H4-8 / FGSC 9210) TaxID=578458 RepID=UPI00215E077A|nr:uncharacterized protein SCHCODRAFT_02497231 [Schizophyllum commune H4-8]KAI5894826.1 hypothetical protein SCHCODRAFT_02497231 [Schizophyllum commune H4-8]
MHAPLWIAACNRRGIAITADVAQPTVRAYRAEQGQPPPPSAANSPHLPFSKSTFVDAICAWIAGNDQSINVIDNPLLRNIFLLLRKELQDADIPRRARVRDRIMELYKERLAAEIEVRLRHRP